MEEVPLARGRIGLIIPSSNRLVEPQFQRYGPTGVQTHVTRLRMTGPHHRPLRDLLPSIVEAAESLADAQCDVIVFHCTASSMEEGPEADRGVVEAIEGATGRRAGTTASAVLEALRALEARRLVLVSPYIRATHESEISFLSQAGLEVVGDRALNLTGSDEYIAVPPSVWLQVTQEAADPRADAYFLSCANTHAIEVIDTLEAALGRPVVTSNQAALWYGLRAAGLSGGMAGIGRLFQLDLPARVAR